MTKVKAGKLSFIITSFDMNTLVKEIVEDLQTITHSHIIHIAGKVTKLIEGDKDRVGQVLINLLTNAIKYSPDSKEVQITLAENGKDCTVAVKDHGIGIEKKQVTKIFDRFYQVRNGKKVFSGLGMGLYIAKEIAERHGGTLVVESSKGKGSTFTLVIPTKNAAVSND
ncbi:hypothetical protein BH11PAT1_BH11PAT1_2430 [soil metagenome]